VTSDQALWTQLNPLFYSWTGTKLREQRLKTYLDALHSVASSMNVDPEHLLAIASQPDGTAEREAIIDRLMVGLTWFMREPAGLRQLAAAMRDRVARTGLRDVRVWCAGCSTGEEPYTVAMVLIDAGLRPTILATDINTTALRIADKAQYRRANADTLSPEWRERFTDPVGPDHIAIRAEVRRRVSFAQHNFALDPTPPLNWGHFDAVVCRNALIYFDVADAVRLCQKLSSACRPGGYFLVGAVEEPLVESGDRLQATEHAMARVRAAARASAPPFRPLAQATPLLPANAAETAPPIDFAAIEALLRSGDLDGALDKSQAAAVAAPLSAQAHLMRGIVLKRAQRPREAVHSLRRARFLDDETWLAPYQLALCLEKLDEAEAAIEAYRHAAQILRRGGEAGLPRFKDDQEMMSRTVADACEQRIAVLSQIRARSGRTTGNRGPSPAGRPRSPRTTEERGAPAPAQGAARSQRRAGERNPRPGRNKPRGSAPE
jgi:chemotaxis protein methyltransferase CheR